MWFWVSRSSFCAQTPPPRRHPFLKDIFWRRALSLELGIWRFERSKVSSVFFKCVESELALGCRRAAQFTKLIFRLFSTAFRLLFDCVFHVHLMLKSLLYWSFAWVWTARNLVARLFLFKHARICAAFLLNSIPPLKTAMFFVVISARLCCSYPSVHEYVVATLLCTRML